MILNFSSIGHTQQDVDEEWQKEFNELLSTLVYKQQNIYEYEF